MLKFVTGYGNEFGINTGTETNKVYTDLKELITGYDDNTNPEVDTFYTIDSTTSKSVKTGMDPEYALTLKGERTNAALQLILSKRMAVLEEAVVDCRIVDRLLGKVITGLFTIIDDSFSPELTTVTEISIGLKPYGDMNIDDLDEVAPTLSSSTPADGDTGITGDTDLLFVFSEDVVAGYGNVIIKDASDDSIVDVRNINVATFNGTNVTVPRSTVLPAGSYYVNIDSTAIKDLSGNAYAGISDSTTLNFEV